MGVGWGGGGSTSNPTDVQKLQDWHINLLRKVFPPPAAIIHTRTSRAKYHQDNIFFFQHSFFEHLETKKSFSKYRYGKRCNFWSIENLYKGNKCSKCNKCITFNFPGGADVGDGGVSLPPLLVPHPHLWAASVLWHCPLVNFYWFLLLALTGCDDAK